MHFQKHRASLWVRLASAVALVGGLVAVGLINAPANAGPTKLPANTTGDARASFHPGNIHDGVCPEGLSDVTSSLHFTIDPTNTFITITAPPAPGVVFVKGGPQFNEYNYGATGDAPVLTANAANLTNLHSPVNNGGNIAQISHWFACGIQQPPPPPAPLPVSVAYFDNLHLNGMTNPPSKPSPWQGDANVVFVGCNANTSGIPCTNAKPQSVLSCATVAGLSPQACYDAGAIRIVNNTADPVTINSVSANVNGCVFSPWTGPWNVPAGQTLILTQTGGTPNACSSGAGVPFNFDTTEAVDNLACTQVPAATSRVTVDEGAIGTFTYNDSGLVLAAGGLDPSCTALDATESHDWTGPLATI